MGWQRSPGLADLNRQPSCFTAAKSWGPLGLKDEKELKAGLGSVRQGLDAAGLPLMTQTFDPYGNPYRYAGPTESATSYGFTGEQTDSNGLVFLHARYYSPAQGRFMQMDPSRQERNPYLYATSSPVNNVDPSGLRGGGGAPPRSWRLARQIVRENKQESAVKALAQLFVDPRLDQYIGMTGDSVPKRLEFILDVTYPFRG